MGRGDKRTKRGKITIGSFGVSRPARIKETTVAATAEGIGEASGTDAKKAPAKKAAKPKKTEE